MLGESALNVLVLLDAIQVRRYNLHGFPHGALMAEREYAHPLNEAVTNILNPCLCMPMT